MNKLSLKKHCLKLGLGKPLREEASKKGSQGLGLPSGFFTILPLRTHHTWSLGEGLLPRVSLVPPS